jgi:RHS repeat-associated protein
MSAWAATTAAGKGIPGCALSVSSTLDFCMEWNAEAQLKRVTLNGNEVARFSYDPNGRRVEKVAGGVTTSYLYDGEDILRETRGAATFKYVHGPGIDEPVAREDGSGPLTYYHADGLGSILKRTNQAGAVVHEYRYDVWGKIEAGAGEPGYAFTGREWDPETGLFYYRARYYSPIIGRFLSEDPLKSMSARLAPYLYAGGSPARFSDPSGLRIYVTIWRGWGIVNPTCTGDAAGTCWGPQWFEKSKRCFERDGGYAFDAYMQVTIVQQFQTAETPSMPSEESPGLTVQQHENLHLNDLEALLSNEWVNERFQSEGFTSYEACECARNKFYDEFRDWMKFAMSFSHLLRDVMHRVDPIQ